MNSGEGGSVYSEDIDEDELVQGPGAKDPLKVRQLFEEAKRMFEEGGRAEKTQAVLNERFTSGRQFYEVSDGSRVDTLRLPDYVPRVYLNLLRNLKLTWTGRMVKDRPFPRVWANEASPEDVSSAEVSNAVLDYQRQIQDMDAMVARASDLAQDHGLVAARVVWDPMGGPKSNGIPVLDEMGMPVVDETGAPALEAVGERLGEVQVELMSIFDFATDGSEFAEQSKWVLFHRVIDKYEAEAILEEAGIKDHSVTTQTSVEPRKNAWGEQIDGVDAWELWHKPCKRVPKGLHCLYVGDKCVTQRDWPLETDELPIAVWKIADRRGSPYGDTHVSDAVPMQRRYNDTLMAIARLVILQGDVKGVGAESIVSNFSGGAGFISENSKDVADNFRWLIPPGVSKDLYEAANLYKQGLYETFGVNEATSGADPNASANAKHAAYISELDAQKMATARRNLDAWLVRICRLILENVKQYVKQARIVQFVGEDGAMGVVSFMGSEISTNVRIEPAPGSERFRASMARDAEQQLAAGQMGPEEGLERMQTGLPQTVDQAQQRNAVQVQIVQALGGEMPEPDPSVSPQVAVPLLREALKVYASLGAQRLLGVRALLQQYMDMGAQAPMAAPQPQGGQIEATPQTDLPMGALQ